MKLPDVLKKLKQMEAKSLREGYAGDAARTAAQRYMLILLNEIAGKMKSKKRKLSAWQIFLTGYLRSGKSLKDASRDWKKKTD